MVAGIGNAIGLHLSSTGAEIGGGVAKGAELLFRTTLGPVGSVLASLGGGLIGSLFHKVDYGTAAVTSNDSKAKVSGNVASDQSAATSLAGSVQDGIAQVAQQLGGILGQYSVAIGQFDGKYRVNTSATNASLNYNNFSHSTLYDFGKDGQAAAISFAIATAVKEGAVSGLSAAVQKAIASSDDINKALQEALNVSSLETFIGGIAAATKKTFDTELNTANARIALARKYGLDIVATEKANAEERTNLITSTLKTQVGSLQDLLTSMKSGDLFEVVSPSWTVWRLS